MRRDALRRLGAVLSTAGRETALRAWFGAVLCTALAVMATARPAMAQTRRTGILVVSTDPPGVAVAIDGERVGNAPLRRTLIPGEHVVSATFANGSVEQVVTVVAGASRVVQLQAAAPPSVTTSAPGGVPETPGTGTASSTTGTGTPSGDAPSGLSQGTASAGPVAGSAGVLATGTGVQSSAPPPAQTAVAEPARSETEQPIANPATNAPFLPVRQLGRIVHAGFPPLLGPSLGIRYVVPYFFRVAGIGGNNSLGTIRLEFAHTSWGSLGLSLWLHGRSPGIGYAIHPHVPIGGVLSRVSWRPTILALWVHYLPATGGGMFFMIESQPACFAVAVTRNLVLTAGAGIVLAGNVYFAAPQFSAGWGMSVGASFGGGIEWVFR